MADQPAEHGARGLTVRAKRLTTPSGGGVLVNGPTTTPTRPDERSAGISGSRPSWTIWDLCPGGRGRYGCRCYAGTLCPFAAGFGDATAFENGDAA